MVKIITTCLRIKFSLMPFQKDIRNFHSYRKDQNEFKNTKRKHVHFIKGEKKYNI